MKIKVAIIGAGIAGLTLAHKLAQHADVSVFEKSTSPGGRMATYRTGLLSFDLGAQYLKIKSNTFRAFLDDMIKDGLVRDWNPRIVRFTTKQGMTSEAVKEPLYCTTPGMNMLCARLCESLNVHSSVKIKKLPDNQVSGRWSIRKIPAMVRLIGSSHQHLHH